MRDPWNPRDDGMLIGFALWLADRARRPLAALGVDHVAFREILRTRLRLDGRTAGGKEGQGFFGAALFLCFAWLAGFPLGLVAIFRLPPGIWMTVVSAGTLGLFGLQLVLYYGALLLDPTDIGVLQSRPVSGRTLFAARLAHVTVYLLAGCAALAFFPLMLGCIAYPWWAVLLVVPLTVLLSGLLALGAVALLYALALALVGPARFQRVALGVQMAMAALLMGGLQPLIALARHSGAAEALMARPELQLLVPPFHFGGLFETVLGQPGPHGLQLAAAALLLPFAALAAAVLVAGRHFIAGASGSLAPQAARGAAWPSGPLRRLGARVCRTSAERAAFDFAVSLSRRDRTFLRSAVPAALGTTIAGLGIVGPLRWEAQAALALPFIVPFAACFGALAAPAMLESARFSEHWAARWIFQALPVSGPRALLRGAVLGLLLGWLAPALLLSGLALLLLAGPGHALAVLAGTLAAAALSLALLPGLQLRVPFTDQPRVNEADFRNMGLVFLLLMLVFGCGALLAAAALWPPAFALAILVVLVLLPRGWRGLDRLQAVDTETGRTIKPPPPG